MRNGSPSRHLLSYVAPAGVSAVVLTVEAADRLAVDDGTGVTAIRPREGADGLLLADTVEAARLRLREIADGLLLNDVPESVLERLRSAADWVVVPDTVEQFLTIPRDVDEAGVGIADGADVVVTTPGPVPLMPGGVVEDRYHIPAAMRVRPGAGFHPAFGTPRQREREEEELIMAGVL